MHLRVHIKSAGEFDIRATISKKIWTLKNEFENNPNCLLVIKKNEKISRNEKCPATGKKFKQCCGAL